MKPKAAAALLFVFPAVMLVGIWTGVDRRWVAAALAVLALARWGGALRRHGVLLAALAAAAAAWLALEHSSLSLKAYPVCVNLGLLGLFGQSLWRPPTVVERIATLAEGRPLDPAAVRYTRTVTKVWCGFFVVNAAVSLATALFASERAWALYNGGIVYVAMGVLFAVEWLVRRRVRARAAEGIS